MAPASTGSFRSRNFLPSSLSRYPSLSCSLPPCRCHQTQGWNPRLLTAARRSGGLVVVISTRPDGLAGVATLRPWRRGWLARQCTCVCFDARHSIDLAGPRRTCGLPRFCGGGATHRPRVSGHQEDDGTDASLGGRRLPRAVGWDWRLHEGAPRQAGYGCARSEGQACCYQRLPCPRAVTLAGA